MTKLKVFANEKLNVAKMTIALCGRLENTVGKEENAGYQHFLFLPTMFSKAFFFTVVKSRDCVVNGKSVKIHPLCGDAIQICPTHAFLVQKLPWHNKRYQLKKYSDALQGEIPFYAAAKVLADIRPY